MDVTKGERHEERGVGFSVSHGASPTTAMTHIAITGAKDGKNVEWMEKVTDEQYQGK